MKTSFTKIFPIVILLFISMNLLGQGDVVTIHVENAGMLSYYITESKKYEVRNLTLTGDLNSTDIKFIREMAGCDSRLNSTNGQLSILNLSDANIVSGGEPYFTFQESHRTENNIFGKFIFMGCKSLTNITIPNTVTSIQEFAFGECTALTTITLSKSVTSTLNSYLFGCKAIQRINVSKQNTVYSDIDGVLYNKDKTTLFYYPPAKAGSYYIPNSVTLIRTDFGDCKELTEFIVSEENTAYSDIDGVLYNKDQTTLICCPIIKAGSYTIPNSVTTIEYGAFWDCSALTSITIPCSVTSIAHTAFWGCSGLKKIYNNNPVPQFMPDGYFNHVDKKTCVLYVPKGSYDSYWMLAGWGEFENIIEMESPVSNEIINGKLIEISNSNNGIIIKSDNEIPVSIYSVSGQLVKQLNVQGIQSISLSKGIYIVKAEKYNQKVIVK